MSTDQTKVDRLTETFNSRLGRDRATDRTLFRMMRQMVRDGEIGVVVTALQRVSQRHARIKARQWLETIAELYELETGQPLMSERPDLDHASIRNGLSAALDSQVAVAPTLPTPAQDAQTGGAITIRHLVVMLLLVIISGLGLGVFAVAAAQVFGASGW